MSNPFDAILKEIAPEQAAPAASPETTTETSTTEPIDMVDSELLKQNTPEAKTPEDETAQTTAAATTQTEQATQATATKTPEIDPFFLDPLQNKPAEVDPNEAMQRDLEEYSRIKTDPDFELFMTYKKAGKTLNDLTKDYEYVDYKKLTTEQLAQAYGAKNNLTEEQIEDTLSEINGMGPLGRQREVSAMQQELEQDQDGRRQKLAGDVQGQVDMHNQIRTRYVDEVKQIQTQMVDKEIYGVKLDAKTASEWLNFAGSFTLQRADGTLATEEIFKIFLERLIPKIQSTAASKSHHQGREEILKEVSRPLKDVPQGQIPVEPKKEVKHDPAALSNQMAAPPSAMGS